MHRILYVRYKIVLYFTSKFKKKINISIPANMQDRANVGHQLATLARRRQICQRFANVANVLPTSLQTP